VVATFDTAPAATVDRMRDMGLKVVVLGTTEAQWTQSFAQLSKALGGNA